MSCILGHNWGFPRRWKVFEDQQEVDVQRCTICGTEKKNALVDHELCHAAVSTDEDGPKEDERGRRVWRCRKHDIEEFQAIVQRHGCYKRDLEVFADALLKRRATPLLSQPDADEKARAIN